MATSLEDPLVHWGAWQEILTFHAGYWEKLVKRAVAHAHLQRTKLRRVIAFHQSVLDITDQACDPCRRPPWPALEPPADEPVQIFGCMHCEVSCANRAGESVHMHKKHGYCEPVRFLFEGTQCPACLEEFHQGAKLQRHLRNVRSCRERLLATGHRFAPQPGIGST